MGHKSTGIVLAEKPSIGIEPTRLYDRSRFGTHGVHTSITMVQLPSGLWVRSFDGADSYVEIAHHSSQLLTRGGTLLAWINPVNIGESSVGQVIDKESGVTGVDGYSLSLRNTQAVALRIHDTDWVPTANNAVPYGSWTMVAASFISDGTTTMYANGLASGTPAVAGDPTNITATNVLRIGNRSGGTDRTFDGYIGLPKILNYPLSAGQIKKAFEESRHWFGV